ncbi:MAG: pyroglutamyl-peptidase I [Fervidobacterium sp.]
MGEKKKQEFKEFMEFNILLTGFEPFGGEKINPSQEIIKRVEKLSNRFLNSAKIYTMILPVSYKRSIEILHNFYEKNNIDFAIHIGQAGGRSVVELERLAVNIKSSVHQDNDGIVENDTKIIENGADAYLTKIDVKKIAEILNLKKKLPVSISYDAGRFICNEIFYFSLHNSFIKQNPKHALFIHVPFLPTQVAEKFPKNKNLPSMDLNTQTKIIFEILKLLKKEL